MRQLRDNFDAMVDITTVITIGIVFAALMVLAYIVWVLRDQLIPVDPGLDPANATQVQNLTWNSVGNITTGFDSAVNLILVAITVFILALAISALLMLRGR